MKKSRDLQQQLQHLSQNELPVPGGAVFSTAASTNLQNILLQPKPGCKGASLLQYYWNPVFPFSPETGG